MGRIAIHGFGRIGRTVMKAALKESLFTPVSVSDVKDLPTLAALFAVDTNYGRWYEEVKTNEQGFVIGGRSVAPCGATQARPHSPARVSEPKW